jgi:hypothetical protein
MKTILTALLCIILISQIAEAGTRRNVSNTNDEDAEGTLKTLLNESCNQSGDDDIVFEEDFDEYRIKLNAALVIPRDCKGKVKLTGRRDIDIKINGNSLNFGGDYAGDNCILNVYSNNHTIEDISFVKNSKGAGICVFGRENKIKNNRFGTDKDGNIRSNLYGVVVSDMFIDDYTGMDGSDNEILGNDVMHNLGHGVWIRTEGGVIAGNTIQANGGCPDDDLLSSHDIGCSNQSDETSAYGIYLGYGAANITIGGDSAEDGNIIQYNRDGGIVLPYDNNQQIEITHNVVSRNYGLGMGIDLADDGFTYNDFEDGDIGPNEFQNYVDYFQVFPLTAQANQFWAWGVTTTGSSVELFGVDDEDVERGIQFGGADYFISKSSVSQMGFSFSDEDAELVDGEMTTMLVIDSSGNTSEFSQNVPVGKDSDLDGIPDAIEENAMDDEGEGSDSKSWDTDGDGLADSVEDKNRNGIWEAFLGETSAYLKDSDMDGLTDYHEIHGDSFYEVGVDTDPLTSDTDGDGLDDGEEDSNGNGLWEIYLGETSPLSSDTDEDGFIDSSDTCPSVYNPGQEEYYCQE